jgi:hypothetical protein
MAESALYVSLEVKNRKLLRNASFDHEEILVFDKTNKIACIETFNSLGKIIEKIMNENKYSTVVFDGIYDIPRWAEKVVIQEIQKKHPGQTTIGENNLAGWAARNTLSYLPMERMSVWAEDHNCDVFITTLMTDEYVGQKKIGRTADAKGRLKKTADARVHMVKDNRGYVARFEKTPGWAKEGDMEVLLKGKDALAMEFMKRGLLRSSEEES